MEESNKFAGGFSFEVMDEEFLEVKGRGSFTCKAGSMVAEKGRFNYERILLMKNKNKGLFSNLGKAVKRKMFGQGMVMMKATGEGTCVLADSCNHITRIKLASTGINSTIKVNSARLLAFTEDCSLDVGFVGAGMLAGQGLLVTKVSSTGNNAVLAISAGSNVRSMKSPCSVDPQALVAFTGNNPAIKTDIGLKTCLGFSSGETYKLYFENEGQTVIYQAGENPNDDLLGTADTTEKTSSIANMLS